MTLSFDFYDAPRAVPLATRFALIFRNAWFFIGLEVTSSVKTHLTAGLGDDASEKLVYDSTRPQNAVLLDALHKSVRSLFGG